MSQIKIHHGCVILNNKKIYELDDDTSDVEALNLIDIGYNLKHDIFKVETLDDQMKLEFIQKIFDKFSCIELEALIKH